MAWPTPWPARGALYGLAPRARLSITTLNAVYYPAQRIYTNIAVVSASLRVLGTWALGWVTRLRTGLVAVHLTCAALPGLFLFSPLNFPGPVSFLLCPAGLAYCRASGLPASS